MLNLETANCHAASRADYYEVGLLCASEIWGQDGDKIGKTFDLDALIALPKRIESPTHTPTELWPKPLPEGGCFPTLARHGFFGVPMFDIGITCATLVAVAVSEGNLWS